MWRAAFEPRWTVVRAHSQQPATMQGTLRTVLPHSQTLGMYVQCVVSVFFGIYTFAAFGHASIRFSFPCWFEKAAFCFTIALYLSSDVWCFWATEECAGVTECGPVSVTTHQSGNDKENCWHPVWNRRRSLWLSKKLQRKGREEEC